MPTDRRNALKVEGLNKVIRTAKAAGHDLGKFKDLNARIGGIVERRAAGLTPEKTGKLKGSIRNRPTNRVAKIHAGGARIPYAGVINWGWPARGIEARHYLTNALKETEPDWVALYEREINEIMDQIKGI